MVSCGRSLVLGCVLVAAACSSMTTDPALANAPAACRQLLVVRAHRDAPTKAQLQAWERRDGNWRAATPVWPAVLGRSGVVAASQKREGDGGTPAGVHPIGPAFGYAPTATTGLAYRQATARDWWIDDPASPAYNTWQTNDGKPAVSAEAMRRDDGQYELGAVLGWNVDPVVPGRGSAIFLHVWKGPDEPTSGCVALAREHVVALLAWLDTASSPCMVVVACEPRR
jgi:L,D-peptidoglycan transpeptidase YkuD (ErfK/YbiS/YcfS/YnhG family)